VNLTFRVASISATAIAAASRRANRCLCSFSGARDS
jgi:hypothetical protein